MYFQTFIFVADLKSIIIFMTILASVTLILLSILSKKLSKKSFKYA